MIKCFLDEGYLNLFVEIVKYMIFIFKFVFIVCLCFFMFESFLLINKDDIEVLRL